MHPAQRHSLSIERYESPSTIGEAIGLLERWDERARLIAGGTDLLLEMQRGARPGVEVLIDVTRVPELTRISVDHDRVRIGATVTHSQVVRSEVVLEHGLPLAQACLEIGSPQLRNRATIAGNLVTASPANDTISALMALDGEVSLASVDGIRVVRIAELYTGVRQTVIAPNELLTEISFPLPPQSSRGLFVKLGLRRAQAISVVHLACVLDLVGEVVRSARIAIGSVAPVVLLAEEAAESLLGEELTDLSIRKAAELAMAACRPIDDIRATAEYRVETAGVMVRRALEVLRANEERALWPRQPVTLSTRGGSDLPLEIGSGNGSLGSISATVNGATVETTGGLSKTLLDWLREDAGPALGISLTGTKEGCAEGECGACTVFLDDMAVMACLVPAPAAEGASITTIEGLAQNAQLHPLQQAFVERGAVQCGFCTPGLVMAGAKLLEERTTPSLDELRVGLSGNLCRCTGYYKIIEAMQATSSVARESQ